MAYGLSSALGIAGLFFIVIGIIMAIIGIVFLVINQNQTVPWWIWFLLVGGVVLGIAGGIMLAVAFASPPECIKPHVSPVTCEYVHAPVVTPVVAPVVAPAPVVQRVVAPAPVPVAAP